MTGIVKRLAPLAFEVVMSGVSIKPRWRLKWTAIGLIVVVLALTGVIVTRGRDLGAAGRTAAAYPSNGRPRHKCQTAVVSAR